MKANASGTVRIIVVLLVLIPALYVGSYLAMAEEAYNMGVRHNSSKVGGEAAIQLFRPLEWIDRQVRSRLWKQKGKLGPAQFQSPFISIESKERMESIRVREDMASAA